MDTTTCQNCMHRCLMPDPATRELVSFCTRRPPTVLALTVSTGMILLTQYPKVDVTFQSCGDFELPDEMDA